MIFLGQVYDTRHMLTSEQELENITTFEVTGSLYFTVQGFLHTYPYLYILIKIVIHVGLVKLQIEGKQLAPAM